EIDRPSLAWRPARQVAGSERREANRRPTDATTQSRRPAALRDELAFQQLGQPVLPANRQPGFLHADARLRHRKKRRPDALGEVPCRLRQGTQRPGASARDSLPVGGLDIGYLALGRIRDANHERTSRVYANVSSSTCMRAKANQ